MTWRAGLVLAVTATALGALAATAGAATTPPNDNRADARQLGPLPQTVNGTTAGATVEPREPGSCADNGGSVWYSVTVGSSAPDRIGIKLAANGKLDAVLDVYRLERSRIASVRCEQTGERDGRAALAFTPEAGATYLIRVAQLADSASGTFSLNVFAFRAPAPPPGPRLGSRGSSGTLDKDLAPQTAYSMRLTAGTVYKVNLVKRSPGCMSLRFYPPGSTSFGDASLRGLSCAGYRLFTPRTSGLWSFVISADQRSRGGQPYSLHVARATSAETMPGIFLPNYGKYTGVLRGNVIDAVRLFRFDVTQRTDLVLFLETASGNPFDLKLLDDQGRYLQCNCGSTGEETIRRQISPGRYFVVVQAERFGWGQFTLSRQSRLITHVSVTIDGAGYVQAAPGAAMHIAAHVSPAVSGPVTIEVDRFDPVERWQFYRYYHVTAVNGLADLFFAPPHIGRWRATVSYDGTRTAAPATSGGAQALVAGPLRQ